jgi:Na+/H+-dicarboxylate symporter
LSKSNALLVAILAGIAAGVLAGWLWGAGAVAVLPLGTFFLNALKMIVVPLVVTSMISGVATLGDIRKVGRTGLFTVAYYVVTTGLAVALGLVLVNIVRPGAGVEILSAGVPEQILGKSADPWQVLLSFVHPSIVQAAADLQVLPILLFSLVFGAALTTLGERGKLALDVFEACNQAIMKVVDLILWLAPIGVFGLVAGQLGKQGGLAGFLPVLKSLGAYAGTVLLGLALHALVVLPLLLWKLGGRAPHVYGRRALTALGTAFATASSSATLPVTLETTIRENRVSPAAARFVLPLGATINMDGTALYEAVAALFIAQAYGIELGPWQQAIVFVTATLAAVGAAGIPQAGLVTMVIVLTAVGLPLEGVGLILTIDWFLDRCRTTVNVWGDMVGAAIVAELRPGATNATDEELEAWS